MGAGQFERDGMEVRGLHRPRVAVRDPSPGRVLRLWNRRQRVRPRAHAFPQAGRRGRARGRRDRRAAQPRRARVARMERQRHPGSVRQARPDPDYAARNPGYGCLSGERTSMGRSSVALDHLRGVVIVIVLAFHSALAYLDYLPASTYAFDAPPYRWRSSPIIDSQRWFGFDLFCAHQDVYLITLMFLLSGLFVWPSLRRKGSRVFLVDRIIRLGLPSCL